MLPQRNHSEAGHYANAIGLKSAFKVLDEADSNDIRIHCAYKRITTPLRDSIASFALSFFDGRVCNFFRFSSSVLLYFAFSELSPSSSTSAPSALLWQCLPFLLMTVSGPSANISIPWLNKSLQALVVPMLPSQHRMPSLLICSHCMMNS